jgi:hypothetical protein
MKVAICISGVPRGYYNIDFIEQICKFYETKLFIFYWQNDPVKLRFQSYAGSYDQDTSFSPYIYDKLGIETWVDSGSFAAMEPEFQRKYEEIPEKYRLLKKVSLHSMSYAIMRANDMREFYEEFHGFKFDCVMRARFETRFFRKEGPYSRLHLDRYDFNKLYKPLIHVDLKYGMNDCFAMSSSKNMSHYSRIYNHLTELAQIDGLGGELCFYHHNKIFPIDSTWLIDGWGFSGYGYHCDDIKSNWY